MSMWDELADHCAQRHVAEQGALSKQAYAELLHAVRDNPSGFVKTASEKALFDLATTVDEFFDEMRRAEHLDDHEYESRRNLCLMNLAARCENIAMNDPESCLHARLVAALAFCFDLKAQLKLLLDLDHAVREDAIATLEQAPAEAWDDLASRPYLRIRAAIARTCLQTAHYKLALTCSNALLRLSPGDPLGMRSTSALALARLEDADGLEQLSARFEYNDNAAMSLARVILMYKLGRLPAAERALRSYDSLCEGGAYALLALMFTEVYLPDRPTAAPNSYDDARLAVHEAENIIADVPDLVPWAHSFDWFVGSAQDFAEQSGLEW